MESIVKPRHCGDDKDTEGRNTTSKLNKIYIKKERKRIRKKVVEMEDIKGDSSMCLFGFFIEENTVLMK